jgi:hypothetical protein
MTHRGIPIALIMKEEMCGDGYGTPWNCSYRARFFLSHPSRGRCPRTLDGSLHGGRAIFF